MSRKKPEKLIDEKDVRLDGRGLNELRPIKIEVGVLGNADGSAYIEQGKNKILWSIIPEPPSTLSSRFCRRTVEQEALPSQSLLWHWRTLAFQCEAWWRLVRPERWKGVWY